MATNAGRFEPFADRIAGELQALIGSPDSSISCCGIRSGILLLKHQLKTSGTVNGGLLQTVARSINSSDNDVKLACTNGLPHLVGLKPVDLKFVVPMLVNGTKEKNSAVRATSEEALAYLLQLRDGVKIYEVFLNDFENFINIRRVSRNIWLWQTLVEGNHCKKCTRNRYKSWQNNRQALFLCLMTP